MESTNRLDHAINSLIQYRKLWLASAILGMVVATVYAFFLMNQSWTARQSMIIRDNLLGQTFGQFLTEESMKSAQETVLETSRRPEVIQATLEKLGPDKTSFLGLGGGGKNWPSQQDIEDYRGAVSFQAANGGEFGKSEVIVLAAKSSNADRSIKFLTILLDEVDGKLADIRAARFQSMESEIKSTLDVARLAMGDLTQKLEDMEASFGADLQMVRSINGSQGVPTAFENKINQIRKEKRDAQRELAALESIRASLEDASRNPNADIPINSELLALQPTLGGLVTGLAKAKEALAAAEGEFEPRHRTVRQGRQTVESMNSRIRETIALALEGLQNQISMTRDQVHKSDERLTQNALRLGSLSTQRVAYMKLEQEVKKRTEDYTVAMARLSEVQSRSEADSSVQLLTRIGTPWVGTRADGIGKRSVALLGGFGGLLIGLGLVLVVAPPFDEAELPIEPTPSDRSDHAGRTIEPRRSSEETSGRQAGLAAAAVASAAAATSAMVDATVNSVLRKRDGKQGSGSDEEQPAAARTDGIPSSNPSSASPSLASIFANMPQPGSGSKAAKTPDAGAATATPHPAPIPEGVPTIVDAEKDVARQESDLISDQVSQKIESFRSSSSSASSSGGSNGGRISPQTIQLSDITPATSEPLPLQRRSSVRPVDLAKSAEPSKPGATLLQEDPDLDRKSIDNAFSELEQRSRKPDNK